MTTAALQLENIACLRGGRMLFQGLSAQAPAGTALIVRGPNGAGKSSLLRMLAGLAPLAAGDAQISAASLAKDRAAFQAECVYAGHQDSLKPTLSAAQNLAFWGQLYGAPTERIALALAAMNLSKLADAPARVLSAGQRRRLGLARLPLIGRRVWLMDEPTVSLDAESVACLADVARDYLAAGGIIVAATHIDLGLDGAQLNMTDFRPPPDSPATVPDLEYWL